jgi:alpha-ribazole phosphatase
MSFDALMVWRHPRPDGAAGRCIGAATDLPVHPRRAKRLARRIQQIARRQRLPHLVVTSPLRRCADVGRWLKRGGWQHTQDRVLLELDFGAWDGKHWADIAKAEIDVWVADFAAYAPGHGEPLLALLARVAGLQTEAPFAVSHGGWMLARRWLDEHGNQPPAASAWPAPPAYSECWTFKRRP